MQWWNSLSIKAKFSAGIGLAVAVSVFSAAISAWSLYGLKSRTEALQADAELAQLVLNLEGQHPQWVNALSGFLISSWSAPLTVAKGPAQCGLGQWCYGQGRQSAAARLPSPRADLTALEAPHKALHATAQKIETLKLEGNAAAREVFQSETLAGQAGALRGIIEGLQWDGKTRAGYPVRP